MSRASLTTLLQHNVAEIKFMRRRPKVGAPPTRRMLCTSDMQLLNSPQGRIALNFRPAFKHQKYNLVVKDLVLAWDIFMQDYRLISMEACELITAIPTAGFWQFFNSRIALMTTKTKIDFMNR